MFPRPLSVPTDRISRSRDVMPDTVTKSTETDDELFSCGTEHTSCWKSNWKSTRIYFYFKLLEYLILTLLRMGFDICAYLTQRLNTLFLHLSNELETSNIMEELAKQTLENRYDFSLCQNKKPIETCIVDSDTVNKLPPSECESSLNQNIRNYEPTESDEVHTVTVNLPLNTEPDSSPNLIIINEEQIEINEVDDDSVNLPLNTESGLSPYQYNMNEELMEYNEIDAVHVDSLLSSEYDGSYIKNTENYEQAEKNIVSTDSVNNSSNLKYINISDENINQNCLDDVDKDAASRKNNCDEAGSTSGGKKKLRSPLDLITQTLTQNKIEAEFNESETKLHNDRKNRKNDSTCSVKEKIPLKKSDILRNEIKSFLKQEVALKEVYSGLNCSSNDNDPSLKCTTIKRSNRENLYFESKRSPFRSEKQFNIIEKNIDILSLPYDYSLACCVAADLYMSGEPPNAFKDHFCQMGTLMDQSLKLCDVGEILRDGEQFVFYLIVKKRYFLHNSLCSYFETALKKLLLKMNNLQLTKLAISKSGLDKITLSEARRYISKVFAGSNIEVTLCCFNPIQTYPQMPAKKKFSPVPLWKMESQTDLIMFINLEEMYIDSWRDEVVENVNMRYPFKDKLLNDISIKPMAAGDVLTYKVDKEVLICIFFKHDNPSYFASLEKAFREIKSQLTGYRYLGIQQDPIYYAFKSYGHGISRHVALLKSVFNSHEAEIWICGDTDDHKIHLMQNYEKIVNDAVSANKKTASKSNANPKIKYEKKKNNSNGFDCPYDSVNETSNNKTSDISNKFVAPTIYSGDITTARWD